MFWFCGASVGGHRGFGFFLFPCGVAGLFLFVLGWFSGCLTGFSVFFKGCLDSGLLLNGLGVA